MLRRQLKAAGVNDDAIARMVARGDLVRVRRGAYTSGAVWTALDDAARYGLLSRAVQLQARTRVVLSHLSGLPEYDAPLWGLDLSEAHITRYDGRLGRREAGVHQHSGRIIDGDVVVRNGVEVMSATRLALEATTVAPAEAALAVVNHLLHQGETSPALLAARYQPIVHWPFTLSTDLVLRLADARIESVGESRTFYLCFQEGLPAPVPQHPITDASSRVVARVDFAWPEYGVYLEFDGRVKYEKLLKPGERASEVVLREKEREELIYRLTGWRCIRLDWSDLAHPRRTAERIRAVLFAAGRVA